MAETPAPRSASRFTDVVPWLVFVVGVALAGHLFAQFWDVAEGLWFNLEHDRHVHYLQGLTLGMSLRQGDVVSFFRQLERLQVWGILHPFLEGLVQLVGGPSYRWAVLPSLCGWVATGVFGFLLTRRIVPMHGTLAGLLAVAFLYASPGHRSYATDIMLESIGAALSLAVLYWYLALVQDDSRRAARWLTITWTTLFFHKSNYWVLITAALVLAELWRHRGPVWAFLRQHRPHVGRVLWRQIRHPLTWLIVVPASLGLYVWKVGPLKLPTGYEIRGFQNLMYVAFIFYCLRIVLWYRAGGRTWLATWPANERLVLIGQSVALAIWFLIPKRLGAFLWFISPANNSQKVEQYVPFYGGRFYTQAFMDDYLTAGWLLYPVLAGVVLLLLRLRSAKAGTIGVILFMVIASTLTMHHPMLKNRHMHSWAAIYMVTGAAGFGMLLHLFGARRGLATVLGLTVLGALVAYQAPAYRSPGHSQEGNPKPERASFLELTNLYQPHLPKGEKVLVVCSVIESYGFAWVHLEHGGRTNDLRLDVPGYNRATHDPETVWQWITKNQPARIVLLDIPEKSRFWDGNPTVPIAPLLKMLDDHGQHTRTHAWTTPAGERIVLFERRNN